MCEISDFVTIPTIYKHRKIKVAKIRMAYSNR